MASIPSHSLRLPFTPLPSSAKPSPQRHNLHPFTTTTRQFLTLSTTPSRLIPPYATENNSQTDNDNDNTPTETTSSDVDQLSEVGEEIKKAMKERALSEGGGGSGGEGFWDGVVEEIGKIEWPEFGKVLGTTGVVLGVIAGSSVVLLTLNAVLAEVSDQVFVGKGVQDFFGG